MIIKPVSKAMRRVKAEAAIISLDIGTDSIKMVKGIKKEGKVQILDFAYRKYPAGEAIPDLIPRYINEILSALGDLKKTRIHATISGRKLGVHVVRLPVMPENELAQAVKSTARKYVSSDLDQTTINFFVSKEVQEKGIKKLEVIIIAIQNVLIDEYLQNFKLVNVTPTLVTSACFSNWDLVREAELDRGAVSLMLVDIEAQETNLSVYRDGQLVFTRNISIGRKDFTDIIKGQSQLSLSRQEDAKLLWGSGAAQVAQGKIEEGALVKIREALQGEGDVLRKEIELTAYHYYQIMHGETINKSVILGEGTQIEGLVDFLKQKSEINVDAFSFSEDKLELSMDKKEDFMKNLAIYTQALGALLVRPAGLNLFSRAKSQNKQIFAFLNFFSRAKMTTAIGIIFVSLGLAIFTVLRGINFYYQYQIKSYNAKQNALEGQILQLIDIRKKMDILDSEKKFFLQLLKERPDYPEIILEICQAIPNKNILLEELKFIPVAQRAGRTGEFVPGVKFSIAGRVFDSDASRSETTNFVLALEQSGYFENISVTIKEDAPNAESEGQKTQLSFLINGSVRLKN